MKNITKNNTNNSTKTNRLIAISVSYLFLSACGATTYDSTIATSIAPLEVSATTLPSGTVEELLPRLVDEMVALSSFIGPNQSGRTKAGKADQLALINALWNAVETDLILIDTVAAESLGRLVDLSNTALTTNRPADADKAARFAGQVVDNFLNP
ncbi:MAG: hypothetical protein O3B91_03510 [Actinomycetota bacterium]|nr:hypothetical protein [Actinomycetota bacterium]MDA3019726.1 hypothetical protein [Actinomycetota bacterium]